jgi:hypothetical protein
MVGSTSLFHAGKASSVINIVRRSANRHPMQCTFLSIRNSRGARRRQIVSRRRRRRRSHSTDQNGRRVRGWRRCIRRWRRCVRGRRQSAIALRRHRQEHVMGETGLVGARPTEVHSTALTTGYRGAIRQSDRSVATVPPDHQGVRSDSILKAPRQQSAFLISGVKTTPENRPVSCRIGNPGSKS